MLSPKQLLLLRDGSFIFPLTHVLIIYQTTILAAAKGAHKLPNINRSRDLKEALQKWDPLLRANC